MVYSRQDAIEMKAALKDLEIFDAIERQEVLDKMKQVIDQWYLTVKPPPATNRSTALNNYHTIESLVQTEKDVLKKSFLRVKLTEANEKFKEMKRLA